MMFAEQRGAWGDEVAAQRASLSDRFVVPPFSVLDTRQGYWQARRREWLALGIKGEIGRPLAANGSDALEYESVSREGVAGMTRAATTMAHITVGTAPDIAARFEGSGYNTSIFDPVLCELAYRWFCPEGGTVLDPFAGGSVRGIVASRLGHPYIGIDLSMRQLDANRAQAAEICEAAQPQPQWLHGDARAVLGAGAGPSEVDLVFTCPPYFDLEVYSDEPADLSAMSWHDFLVAYEAIIELACQRLRRGRCAVIVVSEIRGPDGSYRGLVPRTIHAFERAGMRFYNECILVNSIGSLPVRIGRQFEAGRKVGRTHQNVLVFVKGEMERGWSYEREAPPAPQQTIDWDGFVEAALVDVIPACATCGRPPDHVFPDRSPAWSCSHSPVAGQLSAFG
jgi:hypothetical protein